MKRLTLLLALLLGTSHAATASFYYPTGQHSACAKSKRSPRTLGPWAQVALSPDLMRRYPCGTRVYVRFARPVAGVRGFHATVYDRTAARFRGRVDVLVARHEPARTYGLRSVTIRRANP